MQLPSDSVEKSNVSHMGEDRSSKFGLCKKSVRALTSLHIYSLRLHCNIVCVEQDIP